MGMADVSVAAVQTIKSDSSSAAPADRQAAAATGGGSGRSSSGSGTESSTQYWYSRAYKALKQRASDPAQMVREFQHVTALDDAITHSVSVAKSKAASGRNRYCNVLPYDFNRVVLADQQYINASLIEVAVPHLPQPCSYIATQGPLPATAADFWRMVFDLRLPAVVMLTNVSECSMSKCAQYFPPQANGSSQLPGFELQVERLIPFSPDCTLRIMRLSSTRPSSDDDGSNDDSSGSGGGSGGSHLMSHYHFHAWPDHGTPESSAGIRAVCHSLSTARGSGQPIVVHCSAGIGRTGTFCAIDILLQRCGAWASLNDGSGPDREEVEQTLDLPALVHELRRQRMGMVQTLEQYVFVYKTLVDDLASQGRVSHRSGGASPV